jgi:hypothetical protein
MERIEQLEAKRDSLAKRYSFLAEVQPNRKAMNNVGNNLRDAHDRLLDSDMPKLAAHLSKAIHAFDTPKLCYHPVAFLGQDTRWVIVWDPEG